MKPDEKTIYERIGGELTVFRLVDIFYNKVAQDDSLRAIFPEDLSTGKYWQFLFLTQYWGGEPRYSDLRGHPRLRMRHMPFTITPILRDKWVQYMLEALDEVGIAEPERTVMRDYFANGATFMINRYEESE